MAYAVAQQALHDRHGNLDIDIAMYLDPKDFGYEVHYVDVPVFNGEKYTGEVDKLGSPVYQEEYDLWLSKLPKVKQLNPFHTHRLHFDPSQVTEDKIKEAMDFHLPNFYEAWKAGKTIRSGWDTNTRTPPTRYDKEMTKEQFAARQSLVLQKVSEFVVVSKSVNLVGGRTFPATTIDVGPGATDRDSLFSYTYTYITTTNPANATGILDTFEIYYGSNATGVKVGTFSGSGTSYDDRDYFTWGDVAAYSKQTSTGQSVDVSTGDFVGSYSTTGYIELSSTGGTASYYVAGDKFGSGSNSYGSLGTQELSLYATGDTGATIYSLSCTDGFKIGDTKSLGMVSAVSCIDGLKGGDTKGEAHSALPILSDGLKLGDTKDILSVLALIEGTKLGESVLNIIPQLSLSDQIVVSDTLSILVDITASIIEGMVFGDTALVELDLSGYHLTLIDGLKAGDLTSSGMIADSVLTDGTKLGDLPFMATMLSLIDTAKLGDSSGLESILGLTDGIKLGDSVLSYVAFYLVATSGLKLGDSTSILASLYPVLLDSVKLGDTNLAGLIATLAITDGLKVGDSLSLIMIGIYLKALIYMKNHLDCKLYTKPVYNSKITTGGGI